MPDVEFYEEQKFTQPWLQILLYIVWTGFLCLSVLLIKQKAAGPLPAILLFLFISALVLLFKNMKLITRITKNAVEYRFVPWQRKFKTIEKQEIAHLEVITYNPIRDYGGWGIRYGKKGTAYTTKGNKGLLIHRKTGKDFLLGTAKPEELKTFLDTQA